MEFDYLQALIAGTLEEQPAASYRDIWVVAETRHGASARITLELLGRARELADMLGVRVTTILVGHNVTHLATEMIACGSDTVFVADAPVLADYRTEFYVKIIDSLIREKKPEIVLVGATARGRDLAPRLAARLDTGLISECIALDVDESERLLLGTRGLYGGIYLTTVACPTSRPQIATVRPGCLRALPADPYRQGTVEEIPVYVDDSDIHATIEPSIAPQHHPMLTDAKVIVAGGRGIGGREGFELLKELAELLGGSVAASRSAVELGWAPRQWMVDIAGNLVHPSLYIAVGISGVFPHRLAIRGTRCLVAINKDPNAPIFRQADYGIVGDWREVVPELIKVVRETREQ